MPVIEIKIYPYYIRAKDLATAMKKAAEMAAQLSIKFANLEPIHFHETGVEVNMIDDADELDELEEMDQIIDGDAADTKKDEDRLKSQPDPKTGATASLESVAIRGDPWPANFVRSQGVHQMITVTVLRCNKVKSALLTIDGDGNLKYSIDLCNCPRDCEHYDTNTCHLGLKKDEIKEM